MKKANTSWIPRIAVVLLILVLVSVHLSSGMLARYRSSGSGSDSARVAVFKVTEDSTMSMNGFTVAMAPSDPDLHCATMKVHNESETAIRCTVSVETTGNLPLEFYFKNNPDGEAVDHVDIPVGSDDPGVIYLYAQWAEDDDSYVYHREIDEVNVTLTCVQID